MAHDKSHEHSSDHDHAGHQHGGGQGEGHGNHEGHGGHGDHGDHGGHGGHNHRDHHTHMVKDFKRRFFVSIVLTLPVLALSPMVQSALGLGDLFSFPGARYLLFAFSTLIFFYGGWPFLKGLGNEVGKGQPGMMTLIGVAIFVAWAYSGAVVFGLAGRYFFWELATLIDVMLLGHWIEMRSVMGASKALEKLAELLPSTAHRLNDDGQTEEVKVSELGEGDLVLVKPGERVPADGTIREGRSSVNESMVTGESAPVDKNQGDEVIGGTVNGDGSLKVAVSRTGDESFLSTVIRMVRDAQAAKSRTQALADRAAFWLTIVALSAGAITLAAWLIFSGHDFAFSLSRAVTVMVITCPHALGLAIPLVVAVSTSLSAAKGFLIRNRTSFEAARNLKEVVFDKTGTLTLGEFGVTDVLPAQGSDLDRDRLLALAAAVEAESEHPIAKGIAAEVDSPGKVQDFQALPGRGAEGKVDGTDVKVVSPGYLEEEGLSFDQQEKAASFTEEGKTVVYLVVDGAVAGAIALADKIREEAKEAIAELKKMGIKTRMLTGDNEKTARWVAQQIGLDDVTAEVKPDRKAEVVQEISKGGFTAMVGDGVNDAPALARADLGIAIGTGTDVAAETADVILVRDDPRDVATVVRLARATHKKMVQNLIYATGYNVIAIPLAAGVLAWAGILLSPAVGAALMSLSTVAVAINARFLKVE